MMIGVDFMKMKKKTAPKYKSIHYNIYVIKPNYTVHKKEDESLCYNKVSDDDSYIINKAKKEKTIYDCGKEFSSELHRMFNKFPFTAQEGLISMLEQSFAEFVAGLREEYGLYSGHKSIYDTNSNVDLHYDVWDGENVEDNWE